MLVSDAWMSNTASGWFVSIFAQYFQIKCIMFSCAVSKVILTILWGTQIWGLVLQCDVWWSIWEKLPLPLPDCALILFSLNRRIMLTRTSLDHCCIICSDSIAAFMHHQRAFWKAVRCLWASFLGDYSAFFLFVCCMSCIGNVEAIWGDCCDIVVADKVVMYG